MHEECISNVYPQRIHSWNCTLCIFLRYNAPNETEAILAYRQTPICTFERCRFFSADCGDYKPLIDKNSYELLNLTLF